MSGYRWNNRFNPPLETAAPLFPRRAVETPQVPANQTTHQMPGAPAPILCTNPITRVPPIAITDLSANPDQFTVVATVSFGYRMSGTDHLEFTFTNSNTGVSTVKSYVPATGTQYTIGEFDPGVNYFVYVTPVINGLYTASSATASFLSSPATAPGLLQGVTITGSGSYAIINFTGVYPTVPFPNFVAVNDNFADAQILVNISTAKRFVIGPYTNGSSYQFILTPVIASTGGIYRYGTPITVPSGNNVFIPGPPGTPNITSLFATGKDVAMSLASDTSFHPSPVSYQVKTYTSTLSTTIAGIAGVSGDINDLPTSYPAFTVSLGLISSNDYLTLSAAVGSSNLIADITDNTGTWYSFRVTNIAGPPPDVSTIINVYTFSNPYLSKTPLVGTSFSVKFNTLSLSSLIASGSYGAPGIVFPDVQTDTYTTFVTRAFANNVYSLQAEYGTIFAGAPATPANVLEEKGNQTFRWTVGMYGYNLPQSYTAPQSTGGAGVIGGGTGGGSLLFGSQTPIPIGPRPTYYIVRDGAGNIITTTSGFVTTISGLTNGQSYNYTITGYANSVYGSPLTALNVVPGYASSPYSFVSNISNTTVTFRIGRSLGGAFGYVVTASSATPRSAYQLFLDPGFGEYVTAVFDTGLYTDTYEFVVYAQSNSTLDYPNLLQTNVSGSYTLGAPLQPTNLQGVYRGVQNGGITTVNLTLTASWGTGPIVSQYNISDNYGNSYSTPSLSNYDLAYYFTNLSAYISYSFTVTPFGNSVSGTSVTSQTFNFNPQPPAVADLFMTGSNGGFLNVSFGGTTYQYGNPYDYYSISALRGVFSDGPPAITRIDVASGSPPFQAPAIGILYQFAVYNTICGITSSNFTLTPSLTGGPPLPPTVGYTLGSNTVTFSLSVAASSAVKISNFLITEYYLDISSGDLLPTGCNYTIPVAPSFRPSVSYTLSGVFTASYNLVTPTATWVENPTSTPSFELIPSVVITDTLALATYPNTVILTLSQNVSSLTFPVNSLVVTNKATSFEAPYYSYTYSSPLLAKPTQIFDTSNALQFTWKSGSGPFTGGSYRYDFQSRGNDTLISTVTSVPINLYVAAPGQPTVVTNNTTATVTFSPPPSTSVPASYFVVSDNYGRTVSGTTTASAYVFTNCTTGSAYSYFVTTYAQGISSAPSQPSSFVYPGRPGPPGFQTSFSMLTATLSTTLFPGSLANPYIPITDVCLSVTGFGFYAISRTNLSSSYTTNGPTFKITDLVIGQTYLFALTAYANRVYSTIPSTCNYYVGSLQPNIPNGATIALNNTTAYVSVSASVPGSIPGSLHPDAYVFTATRVGAGGTVSVTLQVNPCAGRNTPITGSVTPTAVGPLSFVVYGGGGGGLNGKPYYDWPDTNPGFGGYIQYSTLSFQPTTINYSIGPPGIENEENPLDAGPGTDSIVSWITGSGIPYNFYAFGGSRLEEPGPVVNVSGTININNQRSVPFQGATIGNVIDLFQNNPNVSTDAFGNALYPGFPGVGGYVEIRYTNQVTPPAPVTVYYDPSINTYSAVFSGLYDQADYTFAGYTITNGLSYGSQWSDPRVIKAGGPRAFTGPVSYSLPAGTPVTQNVSLQVVISTGCGGVTGLWSDTSYFIYVSTDQITPPQSGASVMTLSSYITTVSSGNTYYANVYSVKNQVVGSLATAYPFVVPPALPLTPTISLNSTPNIDVVGPGTQVFYATYPQGSTPLPPYMTTLGVGSYTVTVAGGGGGSSTNGNYVGASGGIVTYTFNNVPPGTPIYYIIGGAGGTSIYGKGAGGGGSAVSIGSDLVYAGGGGGGQAGLDGGESSEPGGAWGYSPVTTYLTYWIGTTYSGRFGNDGNGGTGGGLGPTRLGGGLGGIRFSDGTLPLGPALPGSGGGPSGSVVTTGGGSPTGQPGYVRIVYSPFISQIPALVSWVPSPTSNVAYYYSINSGTYTDNGVLTTGAVSIPYGTTAVLNVYSLINGVSSAPVSSPPAYVFANPPTNLTYGRSYNIVTLSWGSAFQPQHSSNITYTASVTGSTTVSGVSIGGGGGGPSVTIGSNLMSAAVYTQIVNALSIFSPIVVTLSGIGGVTYNASYTVTSSVGVNIQSAIGAYRFGGSGSALPNYTGTNIVFSITNPSALPTNGYTVRDLCSGAILASNIYSNSYVAIPALGPIYNLAVQALNSNLYSPGGSANTGAFSLATTAVSTLSTTYYGSNVQLSWKTPTQFGGVVPTTTPPYTWTIFDSSGNPAGSSAGSPSTQVIPTIVLPLGGTYRYSIITNYYGISSSPTYGNQISLRTTATSSVTQTTLGAGILVSWQTASQSVYLPESPTVLSTVLPNGGYSLVDLCAHYVGTVTASSEAVQVYIPIPSASPAAYNYYNFAVYAIHNGISSPATAPGPIYLGVNPPTSPTVSLNGMVATLTWNAPATNGPNSPYVIFDSSGSQIGDPSTTGNRTLVYSSPGVYSVTTLLTDNVIARAYGAGGGVGAGGFASRTYLNVLPSSTIVVKVGGAGSGGDSSTVYVPNISSPYLILDAGGGGGFTVSGQGFVRDGIPDGGGIGQAGFGSGGTQAILGGGSPVNTNGRVELTMTSQTLSASILTTRTSISFLVNNNTAYNLTIAAYSNGLSNSVSVPLTTTIAAPSNLLTTNVGLQLSNSWGPASGGPGYFITNLATGEYDTVGAVSNSFFPYLGVNGGTYYFAIYSLSGGIPSYQVNGLNRVTLFCPSPSNFKSSYNGSTITFSASGNPNSDTAKFVLTDGSGNILQSNIAQTSTASQVVFAPLFGYAAGQTYNFRLYGVVNGLSSVYVTTSVGIAIPGSTFLGYNPRFAPAGAPAGYTKILVEPMTPYADTYQIISTNLSGEYYSDTADGIKTWVGVAMSTNGNTILAANNDTNGSNIWFSTNRGQNWSCNYNVGRVGYSVTNVAMAANGTTGAVVTSGGVWVTSNVSTLSPWVSVPAITNAKAIAISPDGSRIVYAQISGGIYYGYTSNLSQFSNANGSNILRQWGAIGWSGDGSTLVAISADAGYYQYIQISKTNGQTWNDLPYQIGGQLPEAFASAVTMDSNAQVIYWGQSNSIQYASRLPNGNYYIGPLPTMGSGIPYGPAGSEYRPATSYLGDVVVATNTLTSTVYVSYDSARTWFVDTRYTQSLVSPGFNGSALSSNGLIECVVGKNSTLQSIINTPVLTPAVVTVSGGQGFIGGVYTGQTYITVPLGSDGYTIRAYLKNVPSEEQYLWTTPQGGPPLWPQTTGSASLVVPYASGYLVTANKLQGYILVNSNATYSIYSNISYPAGNPGVPAIAPYTMTDPTQTAFVFSYSNGGNSDLPPGVYQWKIAVSDVSPASSTASITVPLRAPPSLTLAGNGASLGSNISVVWSANPTLFTVTYNIYSNGVFQSNAGSVTTTTVPNSGTIPTVIGVETVYGSIVSTRITASISPPTPPTNLRVTGYSDGSNVNVEWNGTAGAYLLSYPGAPGTITNATSTTVPVPVGTTRTIGVASYALNLLSTYAYITVTNQSVTRVASGVTTTIAIPYEFIVTSATIIGGGGGGGAGGWGSGPGLQGGGGGGGGGNVTFTGGTGPKQAAGTITLYAGTGGAGGTLGNGGGGGQVSYISIGGNTAAWAGGGGGGGGGNGGGGGTGGRVSGTSGGGGSGGQQGTNDNGGGGGGGGSGAVLTLTGSASINNGGNGETRQGTPPNAKTGGGGGNSYGRTGAGGQAAVGVPGKFAGSTGTPDNALGCAGGGGGSSATTSTNPNTSPAGGASADGYISITYSYLTS